MRVPYDFNVNNEYCLMKSKLVLFVLLVATFTVSAQWQPAGDKIKTRWATQIDVNNVLPEYPRPIMERGEWQNLNGLWNYAILPVGKQKPANFDGQILVPFAVESSLSGIQKGWAATMSYGISVSLPYRLNGETITYSFILERWTGKRMYG